MEGIQLCRGAKRVSHLFFADDTLVLLKANASGAHTLKNILQLYEDASGHKINKDKTTIMFSPNTEMHVQRQVLTELGVSQLASNERIFGAASIYR